jgi:hypothetical protein
MGLPRNNVDPTLQISQIFVIKHNQLKIIHNKHLLSQKFNKVLKIIQKFIEVQNQPFKFVGITKKLSG